MMRCLWPLLWSIAPGLGGEPPSDLPKGGLDDVISVDSVSRVTLTFPIRSCDRFKSVVYDRRDPDTPTSAGLTVVLRNESGETCWWDGVALQGTLEGSYTPRPLPPRGLGLMLAADGELSLDLNPRSGDGVRPVVELFIPPGKGIVILRADPDARPPERPERPEPSEDAPSDPPSGPQDTP